MITHNRGIAQTADRVLQVSVFDRIMGNTKYGLIGIQLDSNATEETIAEIRSLENRGFNCMHTCVLCTLLFRKRQGFYTLP